MNQTLLDPAPDTEREEGPPPRLSQKEREAIALNEANKTLQEQFAGVRLSFGKMGTSKKVTDDQKQTMAEQFGANPKFLGATKKILDTKNPTYRACTKIQSQAKDYWQSCTLDYPEDKVRLIRRERLDGFLEKIEEHRADLEKAVRQLDREYRGMIDQMEKELDDLFNRDDYPPSVIGLFKIEVDCPNLAPPEYLRLANPRIYEEQSKRIAARFDEAARLAEEAFTAELLETVGKLQEKLRGLDDGSEKRLKESTLENLTEFFGRFKALNLHTSEDLDKLVAQTESILSGKDMLGSKGITRDDLRNSQSVRADVRTKLSAVSAQLEGLMVATKPRRAITRRGKPAAEAEASDAGQEQQEPTETSAEAPAEAPSADPFPKIE